MIKTNFTREIVLNGCQTKFLTFKFEDVSNPFNTNIQEIYIYPIIEILDFERGNDSTPIPPLNELSEKYKGVLFFNGLDVFEFDNLFKNENINYDLNTTTPNISNPQGFREHNSNPTITSHFPVFNLFGWNVNARIFDSSNNVVNNVFQLRFPNYEQLDILKGSGAAYTNFFGKVRKGEEIVFKIDYNGTENILMRVTFLITSISIFTNQGSRSWEKYPVVFTNDQDFADFGKPGDVLLNFSASNFKIKVSNSSTYDFNNLDEALEMLSLGIKSLHSNWSVLSTTYSFFDGRGSNEYIDYFDLFVFANSSKKHPIDKNIRDYFDLEQKFNSKIKTFFNSSYQLVRTNPKLTGNIKIVVDSNLKAYLDTFESTPNLSNKFFKKQRINYIEDLSKNISNVFKTINKNDLFYVFSLKNDNSILETELSKTYENFYASGVSFLNSNLYDEEFSYFAPLFIKDRIPDYFVIFKFSHSVDVDYFNSELTETDRRDFLRRIFKNSSIVKVFKLRDSEFGNLLNNHLEQLKRINGLDPLKIDFRNNFEKNNYVVGIDFKNGVLVEKNFNLKNIIEKDSFVYDFNKDFVSLWEQNDLIFPNILNIEFLFNDDVSNDYEFNNYFGLYVDFLELKELDVDLEKLDYLAQIEVQTPPINFGKLIDRSSEFDYIQTNSNGFELPLNFYEDSNNNLIKGENTIRKEFLNGERVLCVLDRVGNLNKINDVKKYEFVEDINKNFTTLVLDDDVKFVNLFIGMDGIVFQADLINNSYTQFNDRFLLGLKENSKLLDGESFEIVDTKSNFIFRLVANSNAIDVGRFHPTIMLAEDGALEMHFSNLGTSKDVLKAIYDSIKYSKNYQNVFDVVWTDDGQLLLIAIDSFSNNVKFKRNLVLGSQIDAVTYFNMEIYFENSLTIENNLPTNILSAQINYNFSNNNFVKKYKIKIENVLTTLKKAKFKIYINNGLVWNSVWISPEIEVLDSSLNKARAKFKILDINQKLTELILIYNYNTSPINDLIAILSSNIGFDFEFQNKTQYVDTFIGGVKKVSKNIALIQKRDFDILKKQVEEVVFKTQKNSFSYLKSFDINSINQKIYDIPTENSNVVALELENSDLNFVFGNQKKLVGWKFFKPKLGILSFYPVRDLSFDTILSEYSYINIFEELGIYSKMFYDLNDGDEIELPIDNSFVCLPKHNFARVELYGLDESTNTWIFLNQYPRQYNNGNFLNNIPLDNNLFYFYSQIPTQLGQTKLDWISNYFNTFSFNYEFKFYETPSHPTKKWRETNNISKIINTNEYDGINSVIFSNMYYRNFVFVRKFKKFKVKAIGSVRIINNLYFYDEDFKNFRGLVGLVDFLELSENTLPNLIKNNDPNRFFYGFIKSEYDRLRENKNEKFKYLSKTVPFICRFGISGSDVRDNSISLNLSKAFGDYNFCPSDKNDINSEFFNLEYFVINGFPDSYFNFDTKEYKNIPHYLYFDLNDSFGGDGSLKNKSFLEILLSDNTRDWFLDYFSIGKPTEWYIENGSKKLLENSKNEIYDVIQRTSNFNFCFHKGVKYVFKGFDSKNNVDVDFNFDGFKFVNVFLPIKRKFGYESKEFEIEFVRNLKHKWIVCFIKFYYDEQDFRFYDGFGISQLYFMENFYGNSNTTNNLANVDFLTNTIFEKCLNSNERAFNKTDGATFLERANYIFKFNPIPKTFQNSLNETSFEILNSQNNFEEIFSLLREINAESYTFQDKQVNLNKVNRNLPYLEIFKNSTFVPIIQTNLTNNYIFNFYPKLATNYDYRNDGRLYFNSPKCYQNFYRIFTNIVNQFPTFYDTNLSTLNTNPSDRMITQVIFSPNGYLKTIFENFNFRLFKSLINNWKNNLTTQNNSLVSFKTINEDGSYSFNDFYVLISNYDEVVVKNTKIPTHSNLVKTKNSTIKNKFVFETFEVESKQIFYRYSANYNVVSKDVFYFYLKDDVDFSRYFKIDFHSVNTRFDFNEKFGILKNLFFNKIKKDSNITPTDFELSIDFKDYFIFDSNFSKNYFREYYTISDFENVSGFKNIEETKSIFVGKLINVPFDFVFTNVSDFEILSDGITLKTIKVSLRNELLNLILSDPKSKEEFNYLKQNILEISNYDENEFETWIKNYYLKNIVELYQIKNVIVFYEESDNNQLIFSFNENEIRGLTYKDFSTKSVFKYDGSIDNLSILIDLKIDEIKTKKYYFKFIVERI